jgi:hypothetical protein
MAESALIRRVSVESSPVSTDAGKLRPAVSAVSEAPCDREAGAVRGEGTTNFCALKAEVLIAAATE